MAHFDRVIPPGGEGKIKLSVNTKGYRGNVSKSARVFSNDPVNNVLRLALKAKILMFIELTPSRLIMRGDGTKILTGELQVSSQMDKPLELTPASFSLEDKISYTMEEVEKGKVFKFSFTTKAVAEAGYKGYLNIKTNFPEKPELRVNVSVNIKKPPRIKMSKRTVRMRGRMGNELSSEITIETTDDEPLSLSPKKQTFPEKLSYVVEEVEKGKKFKVRFVTKPAQRAETYQGSLTFGTNYKDQPTLRIHVVVQVK
ncbi:MAG: hypothetical protein JRK53_09040 [Deltaproteobacteria bacterium]|nr:hypothetical protein [Deltaproteobacteria bacterium]